MPCKRDSRGVEFAAERALHRSIEVIQFVQHDFKIPEPYRYSERHGFRTTPQTAAEIASENGLDKSSIRELHRCGLVRVRHRRDDVAPACEVFEKKCVVRECASETGREHDYGMRA